jgi:hypothetical protein
MRPETGPTNPVPPYGSGSAVKPPTIVVSCDHCTEPTDIALIAMALEQNAYRDKRLKRAEQLLKDALDSIEYVDNAHPGTSGWGVRYERARAIREFMGA